MRSRIAIVKDIELLFLRNCIVGSEPRTRSSTLKQKRSIEYVKELVLSSIGSQDMSGRVSESCRQARTARHRYPWRSMTLARVYYTDNVYARSPSRDDRAVNSRRTQARTRWLGTHARARAMPSKHAVPSRSLTKLFLVSIDFAGSSLDAARRGAPYFCSGRLIAMTRELLFTSNRSERRSASSTPNRSSSIASLLFIGVNSN